MIDLHSHTTASDGELDPAALVALAVERGVRVLSITDHDTVAGIARAGEAASAHAGFRLIPGIEISAFLDGRREIHVLGHFVDPHGSTMRDHAEALGRERRARMAQMVERLCAAGHALTLADVEQQAQGGQLGRPHLARALVQRGHVSSVKEAFRRFLVEGRPGFVERERLAPEAAIALIHAAGGTATVAHPATSRVEVWDLERLAEMGLDGVEAHQADCVPSQREKYLRTAARLGLVPTGGSDYHGPTTTPDRAPGSAQTPADSLRALEALHLARRRPVSPVISTG